MKLVIGNTTIPYTVKESATARLKRIIVKPGAVDVVVPRGTPAGSIDEFMQKHGNEVFLKQYAMRQNAAGEVSAPEEYVAGVKINHYGRNIMLVIRKADVRETTVSGVSKITVTLPITAASDAGTIRRIITEWQQAEVKQDADAFIDEYSQPLMLYPKAVRIKEQLRLWASCGKDKTININWQLVRFPKQVLEYVVVHELCHLKYRNHSPEFWKLVGSVFADWRVCKRMLDQK